MADSILVTGGNKDLRNKKIQEIISNLNLDFKKHEADFYILGIEEDEKSLGIEKVREMIKFTTQSPIYGSDRAVIMHSCHKLTQQAQNALLKVLEEPPSYITIILETQNEQDLLATVTSRCKKFTITSNDSKNVTTPNTESFKNLLNMSKGERLSWTIEEGKNEKDQIIQMLDNWIASARSTNNFDAIPIIISTKKDLENTNINIKLALERLVLNL